MRAATAAAGWRGTWSMAVKVKKAHNKFYIACDQTDLCYNVPVQFLE